MLIYPVQGEQVEAFINWGNRESEENPNNNRMLWYIDIE